MTSDAQSPQSEYSRRHRQGVARELRDIKAAVEALNDAVATLLAERQHSEHGERPQ